ncbi:hypothetical protein HYALB_00001011 [Hymenoscyphus albidus]|uniref:NAD(P)-binding domain-containing protein n=1 Tax=Hymenoscyphus albidus TaxID=595503 RepID=A0A9N9LWV0_9HELO|nr:hypothetical protein HYALB_00001011 [Hymenoscyphus albidus]
MPHTLLLGGHGKVSLLMTPKILARNWTLTSLIRDPAQKAAILRAAEKNPGPGKGKIDVVVESLGEVKSVEDAGRILDGAGGKGGPQTTKAIDRDSCINFIRASLARPSITKFLLISALLSRRSRAPWWADEDWSQVQKINTQVMPTYYKAKLAADEVLTVEGRERKGFGWICLRPGILSDEEETERVGIGKIGARGQVTRGDVADVGVRLLEREGVSGWFDLLQGERGVEEEVERVLKEGEDYVEGEDEGVMKAHIGKYDD